MSELLTVTEVAEALRVDSQTVRRWIKGGTLKAIALPHRNARQGYRVLRSTLDDILSGSLLQLQTEPDDRDGNQPQRHYARSGKP